MIFNLFMVNLKVLWTSEIALRRMIEWLLNNELEELWKEEVVA